MFYFSDPNEPTGVIQQFCVRFKNAEIAGTFKTAFEDCQNKLLDAPGFTPGREVSDDAVILDFETRLLT